MSTVLIQIKGGTMAIAIAHHDSDEGRAALARAVQEARTRQTSLLIFEVVPTVESATSAAEAEALRDQVDHELDAIEAGDIDWELRIAADSGSTAGSLVDLAIENAAEILVIGSRRRTAIGKFLLGSTVQRVVLDAPMPVLVVKSPKTES